MDCTPAMMRVMAARKEIVFPEPRQHERNRTWRNHARLIAERHVRLAQMNDDQLIIVLEARPAFTARMVPDIAENDAGSDARDINGGYVYDRLSHS
jgi:hypothetical protein